MGLTNSEYGDDIVRDSGELQGDAPITEEFVIDLISKGEGSTIEFKRDFSSSEKVLQDITCFANTRGGFVLLGVEDDGTIVGTEVSDEVMQQIANRIYDTIRPSVDVDVEVIELSDGKNLLVIRVRADRAVLHEYKGVAYKRLGSRIAPMEPVEKERYLDNARRLRHYRFVEEEYRVYPAEIDLIERVYVEPQPGKVKEALDHLSGRGFLMIEGPMGIGKRSMAMHLAVEFKEKARKEVGQIVRMPRFGRLSDMIGAKGSIILMTDVFGTVSFERREIEDEIGIINELLKGNCVIMTSTSKVLQEALRQTRLSEWNLLNSCRIVLDESAYTASGRTEILTKHLNYAFERGMISEKQLGWVEQAREKDKRRDEIAKALDQMRLPWHIKRFVEQELPKVGSRRETVRAIERAISVQQEVRNWFLGLDDAQKCFVFTLAIFSEFDEGSLWYLYKDIVEALRKLNPHLPIYPLGVLRQATSPYVTEMGYLQFGHPQYQEAIWKEIARDYREYFLELLPLFERITTPSADMPKETLEEKIEESREVRVAIALAAGEIGKSGLDDIAPLLEKWASHSRGRISSAAGIALSKAIENKQRINDILALLRTWARDYSSDVGQFRRWTASAALWRIGQLEPAHAFPELERLAKDPAAYVRSSVAYAMRMMSRTTIDPEGIMRVLAHIAARDNDERGYRNIASVIDEVARSDREIALATLADWSESENRKTRLAAAFTVLMMEKLSTQQGASLLQQLVEEDESLVPGIAVEILRAEGVDPNRALSVLRQVVVDGEEAAKTAVVATLVNASTGIPEVIFSTLKAWAEDEAVQVRSVAALTCWEIVSGYPNETLPILQSLEGDESEEVRSIVCEGVATRLKVRCPKCGGKNPEGIVTCPRCGAKLVPTTPRTNSMAKASLTCGVLGWTLAPVVGAVIAIICGHIANRQIRESGGHLGGKGMATAGLVLGYLWLVFAGCLGLLIIRSVLGVS